MIKCAEGDYKQETVTPEVLEHETVANEASASKKWLAVFCLSFDRV
jgi:hypothetical protein